MAIKSVSSPVENPQVATDELNRVLEVGRLLCSVLKPEEIKELEDLLNSQKNACKLGNTGDS